MGQIERLAMPRHQVHEIAVLDHHALGLAGRTRGIDHISQVLWRDRRQHTIMPGFSRPVHALQIQHRHRQRAQQVPGRTLHQHRHRRAVLQHVAQPLRRIPRVQRHVRTARLQNTQQAHHHFQAALYADRHPVIRPDAQPDQMMRQLVGARIQLRISECARLKYQRNRFWRLFYLRFE